MHSSLQDSCHYNHSLFLIFCEAHSNSFENSFHTVSILLWLMWCVLSSLFDCVFIVNSLKWLTWCSWWSSCLQYCTIFGPYNFTVCNGTATLLLATLTVVLHCVNTLRYSSTVTSTASTTVLLHRMGIWVYHRPLHWSAMQYTSLQYCTVRFVSTHTTHTVQYSANSSAATGGLLHCIGVPQRVFTCWYPWTCILSLSFFHSHDSFLSLSWCKEVESSISNSLHLRLSGVVYRVRVCLLGCVLNKGITFQEADCTSLWRLVTRIVSCSERSIAYALSCLTSKAAWVYPWLKSSTSLTILLLDLFSIWVSFSEVECIDH